MTDRRRHRFNGRVAHVSLRGKVAAERFVDGELHRVEVSRCPVFAGPEAGPRERELVFGQGFTVLDRQDGFAFGFAEHDGYVGWVEGDGLVAGLDAPTHRVAVRHSYAKAVPKLKTRDEALWLSFGASVAVSGEDGPWRRIELGAGAAPKQLWMPAAHLVPVDHVETDPVAVAETLLGTPYLWGGNSGFGIDCSGLVQAACLACGIACPGDSDQQAEELGFELDPGAPLKRGDLLFWKGHVGWVADPDTLLHANAFHMAVAFEPLQAAVARIVDEGGGPVTARRRLSA